MVKEKDVKEKMLKIAKENVKFLVTENLTTFEKNITISSIVIGISIALRSVECDVAVEKEILNEVVEVLAEEILKDKVLVNRMMEMWEETKIKEE